MAIRGQSSWVGLEEHVRMYVCVYTLGPKKRGWCGCKLTLKINEVFDILTKNLIS